MPEQLKFFMSFRGRLMLLLIGFVLLTIILVLSLDNWTRKGIGEEVQRQSDSVEEAVDSGLSDFAVALGMAIRNLSANTYLYRQIENGEITLPATVEHIIVADREGKVSDTSLPELEGQTIPVPREAEIQDDSVDPVRGSVELRGGRSRTYNFPVMADRGLYWIVIVTKKEAITNRIDQASRTLADKTRELSNVRLLATAGLLILALGLAVLIGSEFTRPFGDLANAARRVTEGDLNFRVNVERRDEIGQLATTFNEMIEGLQHKRELEERLNQSERAAVIGRLTQAVAHEIRNPLNVINLSIDHVASKYAPDDPEKRSQLNQRLSSIKDEIARLNRLLNDLLVYGRPARFALENLDLRGLVNETFELVKPQADEQGVQIKVETDGSAADVQGDRERLKSCLSNIAINALQAMPEGGSLVARVSQSNGQVEVAISDSGVGITEDALSKIFEPYYSTKKTGFGLGLAVTKWIIEEHKGTIDVESRVDLGTTFTVRLPSSRTP